VYDMLLASLFFFVVLSPFAINAALNMAERVALRRQADSSAQAGKKDPRSVWAPDTSARAVSSAAPSAR
jgi:membrane protein required for beta-lactamase induction